MSELEREPEDFEVEGPAVLPEREAMGILSQASEPENDDDDGDAAPGDS